MCQESWGDDAGFSFRLSVMHHKKTELGKSGGFASRDEGNRESPETRGLPSVQRADASKLQIARETKDGCEGQ